MQKNPIINFCQTWISLLAPLSDVEFQRRSWFRQEGTEVSTFEEATGNLMERYLDHQGITQYHPFYKNELGSMIKQLHDKIHEYTTNSDSLLKSVDEDKLLNDLQWLSIVSLSQKIMVALNHLIKEAENDKG